MFYYIILCDKQLYLFCFRCPQFSSWIRILRHHGVFMCNVSSSDILIINLNFPLHLPHLRICCKNADIFFAVSKVILFWSYPNYIAIPCCILTWLVGKKWVTYHKCLREPTSLKCYFRTFKMWQWSHIFSYVWKFFNLFQFIIRCHGCG